MAKSKNGGTRAYIRGRIGSDVYSVGKNGKGQRQQVVRALAEVVSNPRTENQMFGRMIMSTVMQAVSALQPIIDHSFDGVANGQPSISEFIRRNYALIKADAVANPASSNSFGLNAYQEKGALAGPYVISVGSVVRPSAVVVDPSQLMITLTASTLTVGGLKAALGLSADGYLTWVGLDAANKKYMICRVQVTTTLADATAITDENVASLFTLESNVAFQTALDGNNIIIQPVDGTSGSARGIIVSELIDGVWKHNTCTLEVSSGSKPASDTVLPTYPTGANQFLNGGDL